MWDHERGIDDDKVRDVPSHGGLGHNVAVVLEHELLGLGEAVEVGAYLGDHIVDQPLRVELPAEPVVVSRAADSPVRPGEFPADKAGDQPALAERAHLTSLNCGIALDAPEQADVRLALEDPATVGNQQTTMALPDWLESEVIVHAAVAEPDLLHQLGVVGLCVAAAAQ